MIYEREMPPEQVLAEFHRWENRMRARSEVDDAISSLWKTAYWSEVAKVGNTGRFGNAAEDGNEWIEVNRIGAFVTGYQAALHDPRMKIKISADPEGRGNPKYVSALVNDWMMKNQTIETIHEADKMAIMRPGVSFLLGFDEKDPDILGRVFLRAVPWRETIPDVDVGTLDEQRFIARCYCMPLAQTRRMFRDTTIKGRARPSDAGSAAFSTPLGIVSNTESTTDRVVRVLNVINLLDPYYIEESDPAAGGLPNAAFSPVELTVSTPGRLEWYLPDEDDPNRPRKVLPIPYRDLSGRPVSPMIPMTYLSLDGLPLHGMAHVERILDQCRETNLVRSRQATGTRKDTIQYMAPENLFDEAAKGLVRRSVHSAILEYKPKDLNGQPIQQLVAAWPQPNLVYQYGSYQQAIDADILGSKIQAPSQSGRISGGSATEVLDAISAGTSEIEMLRTKKRVALEKAIRAFVCILRASMGAAAGDATVKATVDGEIVSVRREDLMGDFRIEIEQGESSTQEEQRELQKALMFGQAWLPLAQAVVKGDGPSAVLLDEIVARAKMPPRFLAENVRKLVMTQPEAAIPRGPGAGSAVPGHASMPPIVGGEEVTPGGPQPNPEQPIDNQTGVAQNGTAQV